MQTLLTIAFFIVANLLLTTLMLWQGARWLGAGRPFLSRAGIAALGMFTISAVLYFALLIVQDEFVGSRALSLPWVFLVASLVQLGFSLTMICNLFRATFARTLGIWAIGMIPSCLAAALVVMVLNPFVFAAYVVPANSMAPTVNGWHRTETCPHCGQPLIVPAQDPGDHRLDFPFTERRSLGICSSCWKTSEVRTPDGDAETPDRVVVSKQLKAKRWDIVSVENPRARSLKTLKRLVGMPGEAIFIEDGSVWLNGTPLQPPPELRDVRYTLAQFLDEQAGAAGTRDDPWRLGADEYFLLGDFSERSSDSRYWGPVPGSHIEGVVAFRYWPLSRWRLFR
jgi:signal peptidase I